MLGVLIVGLVEVVVLTCGVLIVRTVVGVVANKVSMVEVFK